MNYIIEKYRLAYWTVTMSLLILIIIVSAPTVHANSDIDDEKEEGGITQHDMFDFEAFIKHGDVKFGTAPFDSNDDAGNDSSDDNGIVRTWDTVTYPLKITINPKKADSLKNIKLKITGTLENGVSDGNRINANYAVGGKEDLNKKEVSFIQEYTIERTGNSIMIPVTIEVQGAKHDVKLRPNIKVEVLSVDGEKINGVVTHFDELPSATVSAKISIKPIVGSGLAGQGLQYFPFSGITGNMDDYENTHSFGLSWGVIALPGKSNIRGATFPDPNGKINYDVSLTGTVAWDNPARTENLDFSGRDTPFVLLDQRPISRVTQAIGAKNTHYEGVSYTFGRPHTYSTPLSKLASASQSHHSVLDSGEWEVEKPAISKHTVKYDGHNTGYKIGSTFPRNRADGYVGSFLYGVNERVFSTNAFMVLMPNEYRIGGPNNPDDKRNNVNYRATVKMLSYTDENGKTENFDNQRTAAITFVERNEPSGNARLTATFFGEPGGATLGTPIIGDNALAKGDASTLNGLNVRFRVGFLHRTPIPGGYAIMYRWNTDAFELTKAYATRAEAEIFQAGYRNRLMVQVRNDRVNQSVVYGVAKFGKADNVFDKFTKKTRYDYDWYDTYDKALQHGDVGAMLTDYRVNSVSTSQSVNIPLRVKHDNIGIGSFTKDGSANIAVTNAYTYPDENRETEVDFTRGRAYHNPAIWDENGVMDKIQSPSRGGAVNFETLAVVPAQSATVLRSNKMTYYNSETVQWTASSSIVLPESGLPDDLDAGVKIKHVLPNGLDYVAGSGRVGNSEVEPELITHSNGTKTLEWNALVSSQNHSIPDVKFNTTINPFALSAGIQSSQQVTSVIESELDMRPVNLRTSTADITIIKVGMVGIHESINKTYGDKNSDYVVTLSPYTTIEDELKVTGLTHLPKSDVIGSKFDGSVGLKDIVLSAEREYRDSVDIYLNKSYVYDDKPNLIDVAKGGWYKYTGKASELNDAKSIYFIVNGLMSNKDVINIDLTVQTKDNNFGNEYLNETVINSATDYKLSPISNRVRYSIRPDWELGVERLQIYTNKHDKGLPVRVRIGQQVLGDINVVKDYTVDVAIYDMTTNNRVAKKTIKQKDLQNETDILVPADKLTKNNKRNYEIRLENVNDNKVWVKEAKLNTDGYTASEKAFTNSDIINGKIVYSGVTMTEREAGKGIVLFNEKVTIDNLTSYVVPQVTKSGYGYSVDGKVIYENPLFANVVSRVGIDTTTGTDYTVDSALLDDTFEHKSNGDKSTMRLNSNANPVTNTMTTSYETDKVLIENGTGKTYTQAQAGLAENASKVFVDTSGMAHDPMVMNSRLFVPIWITSSGQYGIGIKSTNLFGSNHVAFKFDGKVDVEAFMFNHIDSETTDKDEMLIHQNGNRD